MLCHDLASPITWDAEQSREVADRIKHEYYVHLLVDNLPAATKFVMLDTQDQVYERGFKLGFVQDDKVYINNHLRLILSYHTEDDGLFRIVRFEVEASSVDLSEITVSIIFLSIPIYLLISISL